MPDSQFTVTRHIQLLTGTTAVLNSSSYILLKGQPCYDLESKELRIGDGTKKWSELESITADGSDAGTNLITLGSGFEVVSVINKTFDVDGDVTHVVKTTDKVVIGTDKYPVTSVVFNSAGDTTTITLDRTDDVPSSYIGEEVVLEKTIEDAIQVTYDLVGSSVAADLTAIMNELTTIKNNITNLTSDNTDLTDEINTIKGNITTITTDVSDLKDDVTELQSVTTIKDEFPVEP